MNLNDSVASMLSMLERLIGENIDLIWQPDKNIWPVLMDNSQIDQILANLVVMPEIYGSGLAKRLKKHCPGIRVLYMSGYKSNVIAHRGILDDGVHFIQKPFSLKDLSSRVKNALQSGGPVQKRG